jgi:hypothetical protein
MSETQNTKLSLFNTKMSGDYETSTEHQAKFPYNLKSILTCLFAFVPATSNCWLLLYLK